MKISSASGARRSRACSSWVHCRTRRRLPLSRPRATAGLVPAGGRRYRAYSNTVSSHPKIEAPAAVWTPRSKPLTSTHQTFRSAFRAGESAMRVFSALYGTLLRPLALPLVANRERSALQRAKSQGRAAAETRGWLALAHILPRRRSGFVYPRRFWSVQLRMLVMGPLPSSTRWKARPLAVKSIFL